MISLLVVEDHEVTKDGLCLALSREEDLEIAGSANDSDDGLANCRALMPDVVLLDLHLLS